MSDGTNKADINVKNEKDFNVRNKGTLSYALAESTILNDLGQTGHDYVNYGIALIKYDNVYCS